MRGELDEYVDVLLGREVPPFDAGVATMMEYASAAMGRALEIQKAIHRAENDGRVVKNDLWYRFRTGELRDYIDIFKNAFELGSRRVTVVRMEYDMEQGSI